MRVRVLSVQAVIVDGVRCQLRRARLLAKTDGYGRQDWELTGWADAVDPALRRRLVEHSVARVSLETQRGLVSGPATVSLMAFADAAGPRTFLELRAAGPLVPWPSGPDRRPAANP
jgi:hypothetical protein